MARRFTYFILLAEMRTGSNFLESNLNAFPGISCHGEAFNPHFVGYPKDDVLFGINLATREKDPVRLLNAIRKSGDGVAGFRFFHDHDQRILKPCLEDPRCAKVILTRNPVDSYVSWKIAQETGQWKLTNVKHQKSAKIRFDAQEFDELLATQRRFRDEVQHVLQTTGQSAFFLNYDDLSDLDVINGLARFLGEENPLDAPIKTLKKQNPSRLEDKVVNHAEMIEALSGADHFNLSTVPNFEPPRGPVVPSYVAASGAPLLFLPTRSASDQRVVEWLGSFGDEAPLTGFNQKSLRQWKRRNSGHRSFTVISHPAARAHAAFCRHVLNLGPDCYVEIRDVLRKRFDHPLPAGKPGKGWNRSHHREAFLAFLGFLKSNLSGQTAIRIDPAWAGQATILHGIAKVEVPDIVIREEQLAEALNWLASDLGIAANSVPCAEADTPFTLDDIYDDDIEKAVKAAYQRDYMSFGFGPWKGQAA